jgi:hypothetical protein
MCLQYNDTHTVAARDMMKNIISQHVRMFYCWRAQSFSESHSHCTVCAAARSVLASQQHIFAQSMRGNFLWAVRCGTVLFIDMVKCVPVVSQQLATECTLYCNDRQCSVLLEASNRRHYWRTLDTQRDLDYNNAIEWCMHWPCHVHQACALKSDAVVCTQYWYASQSGTTKPAVTYMLYSSSRRSAVSTTKAHQYNLYTSTHKHTAITPPSSYTVNPTWSLLYKKLHNRYDVMQAKKLSLIFFKRLS